MAADLQSILAAIRGDPDVRGAIRREILSEDLLGLPARTEELAARIDARFAELAARLEELATRTDARFAELAARLEELATRTDARFAELAARLEQLTARVDALTARVDALTASVDELTARVAELTARLDQLAARLEEFIAHMDERFTGLTARVARLEGYVGVLRGAVYERAAVRPRMVAGAVGAPAQDLHAVEPEALTERLAAAVSAGALTDEEADAVELANGVFRWDRGDGEGPLYCVVEASISPGPRDVTRAVERATWLGRTGVTARPVVIGAGTPGGELSGAMRAKGVAFRRVQQPKEPIAV